jgi:hypothetical protein
MEDYVAWRLRQLRKQKDFSQVDLRNPVGPRCTQVGCYELWISRLSTDAVQSRADVQCVREDHLREGAAQNRTSPRQDLRIAST